MLPVDPVTLVSLPSRPSTCVPTLHSAGSLDIVFTAFAVPKQRYSSALAAWNAVQRPARFRAAWAAPHPACSEVDEAQLDLSIQH